MGAVHVAIFHRAAPPDAGPLERAVADARVALAERHRRGFAATAAASVTVVAGPPDGLGFGTRLRRAFPAIPAGDGVVVLGSGAVPLLTAADRRRFVVAAAAGPTLANHFYSADIVAIPDARDAVASVPSDLTDNALPRWLAETRGRTVDDLRGRWRLAVDIDGPLDLVLLGERWARPLPAGVTDVVRDRMTRIRGLAADARAELLVAGRTSAASVGWLEGATASRTRVLIEERGLRTRHPDQRPAASVLGALLERDGPSSLGMHVARLADGAVIDSRVLLAHHVGADERDWPAAEDRFASDLLQHEGIADPWLRALTRAAAEAPIPVLLGGHTLVGPGLRLALRS